MMPEPLPGQPPARKVIGIIGGMGPFAHIELESRLLAKARELTGAVNDQDYPEWIVSSIPQTPDRTLAILGGGAPDPAPFLLRSLKRLENRVDEQGRMVPGADLAVVACNTSHWFLAGLRHLVSLPILDLVEVTAAAVAAAYPGVRVGLLATTGTLVTRLYHGVLEQHGLTPVSLLDLPGGAELQRDLVMCAVYGPWDGQRHAGGGIKTLGPIAEHTRQLTAAGSLLITRANVEVLVLGCTEISLAIRDKTLAGVPCIDPLSVVAEMAIRIAYGLPPAGPSSAVEQA